MILEWDSEKAASNFTKHGVDFHEAGTVLDDPLSTTFPDPTHSIASSAPGQRPRPSDGFMSKASKPEPDDDLLPEYDFSSLSGGVRGKYCERYRAGVNLALLEPDIAKAFPTDAAVNDALRRTLRATKALRRPTTLPSKRMKVTRSAKAKRRRPHS